MGICLNIEIVLGIIFLRSDTTLIGSFQKEKSGFLRYTRYHVDPIGHLHVEHLLVRIFLLIRMRSPRYESTSFDREDDIIIPESTHLSKHSIFRWIKYEYHSNIIAILRKLQKRKKNPPERVDYLIDSNILTQNVNIL